MSGITLSAKTDHLGLDFNNIQLEYTYPDDVCLTGQYQEREKQEGGKISIHVISWIRLRITSYEIEITWHIKVRASTLTDHFLSYTLYF